MSHSILQSIQRAYHALLPQRTRLRMYKAAPEGLKTQLDHWSQRLAPAPPTPFSVPTDDDIYYCYRLLLKKEPSPEELSSWREHIDRFGFDLDRLVHEILYSDEYVQKEAQLNQPHCVDLNTFKLYVRLNDFATSAPIARTKSYEPAVTAQIRRLLNPGNTFVDVGANVGYFTMLAASITGTSGQVIAFEPNPANGELIRLSISENSFERIVTYHQAAVGAFEGTLELLVRGTHSNARLLTDSSYKLPSERPLDVPIVTLDQTLSTLDALHVIKIDVEGAENLVWQGMQQVVERHRPAIIFEYFPESIRAVSKCEPQDMLHNISAVGYQLYWIDDDLEKELTGPLTPEHVATLQEQTGLQLINLLATLSANS
ncbi:MAG: FkbM family methyltransferase [Candidatus Promineifilaceae bacterium]|nr:FkbM family methyltransferase [Candidatus Promineifilaceae bacterium]